MYINSEHRDAGLEVNKVCYVYINSEHRDAGLELTRCVNYTIKERQGWE